MQALILAGGKGSRMGLDIAKCSVDILDIPIINYVINSLDEVGISDINIVVGYKKDDIIKCTKHKYNYIVQEQQLGTGNAVKIALDYIKDDVIIIPGDTLVLDSLDNFIRYHYENNNDFSIMSFEKENPSGYGRIIRGNDIDIVEDCYLKDKDIKECNSGIYITNKRVLLEHIDKIKINSKSEYYFTDIVKYLAGLKVGVFKQDNIYGVNTLHEVCLVNEIIKNKTNERLINSFVYIVDKNNTYISPDCIIEENTVIEPGCIIYHSRIGKGNKILANSRIINSVIGDDNKIISSDISDSFIGRGNNIGPFSHLRNYANIGNFNRIGNYVEIKDSVIDSYTNASHLAYIGNTDCGSGVNFGCGSITVNYDGKNKHKTVIKDKAFIGCNSNLIAPVVIKENSFIAAGSTITNDVEEDSLAIARVRQINKDGYLRKKNPDDNV